MKKATILALAVLPALAWAEEAPVETRRAAMKEMSEHFKTLGEMARGKADYDVATATAAAQGIADLAATDWLPLFPEGTAYEQAPKSEASADIWTDLPKFEGLMGDLVTASQTLTGAAGEGLDALRPAVMGTAKTCSACHTPFRVSN